MNDMRYDVAVVGAGQAGLAIGHALAEQKQRFVILEAADSVGSACRGRWDSLVLRRDLKRHGVAVRPRAVGADDRIVRFADGSELEVDAVIWATGYRPDHSWIDLPINGNDGRLRHRRGVTDVPGLSFLGLSWQHTRGSALLGFVADDAAFIAGQLEREPSRGSSTHCDPEAAKVTEGAFKP